MKTDLFDYELPPELIAQAPADRRDHSRLLVYDRRTDTIAHHVFHELPALLPPGTHLFRNNASVLKARIRAYRPTGGAVEILLLNPDPLPDAPPATGSEVWRVLLKPAKKLPPGTSLPLGNPDAPDAVLVVLDKFPDGQCRVRIDLRGYENVPALAEALGEMPLPPYIQRPADGTDATTREQDNARYQTVFADPARKVAAAAPTAGLHFTPALIDEIERAGHVFHDLTLHVGLGTFKPVTAEHIEEHPIHTEFYEIPPATLAVVESAGASGKRLAVGTTSLRSLEDYHRRRANGEAAPPTGSSYTAEASLYIYPPSQFLGADHLLTNFHLPRSTLLALVAAFLAPGSVDGIKRLKSLYNEAIEKRYRFFSYGDAMLIK